jgi:hypothetical protein
MLSDDEICHLWKRMRKLSKQKKKEKRLKKACKRIGDMDITLTLIDSKLRSHISYIESRINPQVRFGTLG